MESYNLIILHYVTGTVEYANIPSGCDNIPDYITDVLNLSLDDISWMYKDGGLQTVYSE